MIGRKQVPTVLKPKFCAMRETQIATPLNFSSPNQMRYISIESDLSQANHHP